VTSNSASTTPETTPQTTPPVIQINGANPSTIHVGDTYTDLGTTITGPQQDLNLGITTFLNGTLTNSIIIDTTQAATDTIQYVATDQSGLTSTSTRTVIIEPNQSPTVPAARSQPPPPPPVNKAAQAAAKEEAPAGVLGLEVAWGDPERGIILRNHNCMFDHIK
jgi:hypothetical protein